MNATKQDWTHFGAYTPDQAARLLGIAPRMVKRWVYGNSSSDAALIPQFPAHKGELITFLDFVQTLAIRDIRKANTVSLQKVRATINEAKRCGVLFPFARKHTTYVFSDDIVLRMASGDLITVTGKYKNQKLIDPVVYSFLTDLGFDERGLADSYIPIQDGFRKVILSPLVNFGSPTIYPCRYTVRTLVDAYCAEGESVDRAASVCDVNEKDIRMALRYEQSLAA